MGVGEGTLGLALLGSALGVQIALMFAGPVMARLGHRLTLLLCIPLLGVAETVATLSTTPQTFFFILLLGGLTIGTIEIIVNLEADRTEHMIKRRIMNRSHAFWSFGFFTAGLVGAIASQLKIDLTHHIAGLTVFVTIAVWFIFAKFEPAPARATKEGKQPKIVRPSGPILLIVAFTLSAMLLEGAGADWSVIFMRDMFSVAPFIAGLAFAIGALTQGVTRFFADGFIDRFGIPKVARASIFLLGVGVLLVVFSPVPMVALAGFGLMGVGSSSIFPMAMSAAAQRTDRPAATNVASLAQFAFVVFLVGPPLLGFVAEHFGIRMSFAVGIPLVVVSWFTISSLNPNAQT